MAFSISIDATKVPPVKQLAKPIQQLLVATIHFTVIIDDNVMHDKYVQNLLVASSSVKPALEVKVLVATLQKAPEFVPPSSSVSITLTLNLTISIRKQSLQG